MRLLFVKPANFAQNILACDANNFWEKQNPLKKSPYLFKPNLHVNPMLENGADIRFIQAMLGHVKLDTTQIYTQVSIKKLKEVHSLTHPAKAKRTKKIDWDNEEPEATEEALLSALVAEESEDGDD